MTKHNHDECKHEEVKYCVQCDAVYCEHCPFERSGQAYIPALPYQIWPGWPNLYIGDSPWIVTSEGTGTVTIGEYTMASSDTAVMPDDAQVSLTGAVAHNH